MIEVPTLCLLSQKVTPMTNRRSIHCAILLLALLLCTFARYEALSQPRRISLPIWGSVEDTLAWSINASGQVTGYAGTPHEDTITGFIWNPTTPNSPNGTIYSLGTLGGEFSWGTGINVHGQVVGVSATTDDASEHATLWNPTTPNGSSGTLHSLGTLGGTYSQANGVNSSGQVAGISDVTGDTDSHAFLWNPNSLGGATGTMHDLGTLGGTFAIGWDINGNGQVTGSSDTINDTTTHAFVWNPSTPNATSGTMHDLGTLGGTSSDGAGMNDNGQVAGSSQTTGDAATHAFLWTPSMPGGEVGTMLDLGTLGGQDSYSYTVGNNGRVVGTSQVDPELSNYSHAFLYTTADGMIDLNTLIDPLSGWELLDADAINDAGQITGQGLINDEYHAFLLTPLGVSGDYDGTGIVDAADYTVWRDNVGGNALINRGAGIVGPVGAADYEVWKSNFGQSLAIGRGAVSNRPAFPNRPQS